MLQRIHASTENKEIIWEFPKKSVCLLSFFVGFCLVFFKVDKHKMCNTLLHYQGSKQWKTKKVGSSLSNIILAM